MIYIKEYNSFNIHTEIEEATREVFIDFMTEYSLEVKFTFEELNRSLPYMDYEKNEIKYEDTYHQNSCRISFSKRMDDILKSGNFNFDIESEKNFEDLSNQLKSVLSDNINILLFEYDNNNFRLSNWNKNLMILQIIVCWK